MEKEYLILLYKLNKLIRATANDMKDISNDLYQVSNGLEEIFKKT